MVNQSINFTDISYDQFKTFTLSLIFQTPLERQSITKTALLAQVLRKATCDKDFREINLTLERLYGAQLDISIFKSGEAANLAFTLSSVSDRFLPREQSKEVADLLFEVIFSHFLQKKPFSAQIVERERVTVQNDIESVINDKRVYATIRMLEEMCKDEPYGIRQFGYADQLPEITPEILYKHYCDILTGAPMDLLAVGNVDGAEQELLERLSQLPPSEAAYCGVEEASAPDSIKMVSEQMDVTQGKLVMGFRTPVPKNIDDIFKLLVYNSVLGSGVHSKLFQNVREKLSLCYYASSTIERKKGILTISAGIETQKFQQAKDEIFLQMRHIEEGQITELEQAKVSLINSYRQRKDELSSLRSFYLEQLDSKPIFHIEQAVEAISTVTVQDVIQIANQIKCDTIYFLTGREQ